MINSFKKSWVWLLESCTSCKEYGICLQTKYDISQCHATFQLINMIYPLQTIL